MESLKEARKGIRTQAGQDMANKRFQLDRKKADENGDGELTKYEEAKAEAVQKAKADGELVEDEAIPSMAHGGMPCGLDDGIMVEPETGNEIPIGSSGFIDDNKNGIWELALTFPDRTGTYDDGDHPGTNTAELFVDKYLLPTLNW